MEVAESCLRVRKIVGAWRGDGLRVGFVPTMGALHEGHLSLVRKAIRNSDRTVVSIFLNPLQFGPEEDLESYPRDLQRDTEKLDAEGVHCVFAPGPGEIYTPGHCTSVHVSGLTETLCGRYRKGHFDGVTTVCAILFGIVRPDVAVFGRKDAQQLAVVRRMVSDLRLGVEILAGDIVREEDGLAMSSRNAYLSDAERSQAPVIHRALLLAESMVRRGETSRDRILGSVREMIERAPLAEVQYLELVDPLTLEPAGSEDPHGLLAVAVYFGNTRLIDNIVLGTGGS